MSSDEFTIRIGDPISAPELLPPEDPLGELSPLQMGLKRFCFERNHVVVINMGDDALRVSLYPDVCLLLDWLPARLAELRAGRRAVLELPESMMAIELMPEDHSVHGVWRKFGYSREMKSWRFDRSTVIDALDQFFRELLRRAVEAGYVTAEDADGALRE